MTTQIKKYQDYKPKRFTKEQIQDAKDFPISDLLANYGLLNGAKKVKQGYFILNPFEDEKTPSFLVNTSASKNFAKAFNNSKGYDTISFTMNYENISFVEAVKKILNLPGENNFVKSANIKTNKTKKNNKKVTRPSDLKPLTDAKKINALKYYLKKVRFVSPKLAQLHGLQYLCKENYYYLATINDKKGIEVKNKIGKWCFGSKSIKTIINKTKTNDFTVFEAFLDYMSYLELYNLEQLKTNVIILNGTGQTKEAIAKISTFKTSKVFLVLDNDKAGIDAKELFKNQFGSKIIDLSNLYSNFKDVNDLLTSKRRIVQNHKNSKNND